MSTDFRRRTSCTLCNARGADLEQVLELAATPPANEFLREEELASPQASIPLSLLLCLGCGHLQLAEVVDPERLFGHYVYVSGTSPVFVAHFNEYAKTAVSRFGLGKEAFVVDIGSNDGTLLRQFQTLGLTNVLGIDPALEIAAAADAAGVPTIHGFFTPALAKRLRAERGAASLICANNVFAHTESLQAFGEGVKELIADEGVFVFEVSYLVDVVQKLLFDTIYHEHLSYHAVRPLVRFFERIGMRLFDAERVDSHGGSLRCYVCLASAQHQQTERLAALIALEESLGLFSPALYREFKARISERGRALRERVKAIRAAGQSIAGFGAPAKLTTLMHEFGLTRADVEFIVDDSAWKQGRFTPGTQIPVVPATRLYERMPAWCIVFAWNFADSIIGKHERFVKGGGRFLVPLPELREVP